MNNIKPIVANDLDKYELFRNKKGTIYTIGSLKKDRFVLADEKNVDDVLKAYKLFDGNHTLNDVGNVFINKHKVLDTYKLFKIAEQAGLIENSNKEKIVILNEFQKYGVKILNITLKKKWYNIFHIISKLFNKLSVFVFIVLLLLSISLMPDFGIMISKLNIYNLFNSTILSLMLSSFITTVSVLMHETSHAAMAMKYGLKPRKVSVSIYLFSPIIYITIPGIYTLSRNKRLLVHSAGILMNFFLFSLSVVSLPFVSGILRDVMLLTAFNNLGLIVTNIVPFLPLDGYFILMNLLKIPNLRRITKKKLLSVMEGNKIDIIIYSIYNFISVLFIIAIVCSILYQLVYNFKIGWSERGKLSSAVFEIRGYLLTLAIICISKIINYVKGSE
jgi:putative peptide zinc metalloprotease protein